MGQRAAGGRSGRALARVALLGLPLLLGGCGFSPMYGGDGGALSWRQVEVAPQRTRAGQLVRNALLAGVAPADAGGGAYVLDFSVQEREEGIISREDIGTARQRYSMTLEYELSDRRTGRVLTRGRTLADVSYAITRQHFADEAARAQARETVADVLARDVRARVASWLARRAREGGEGERTR